MGQCSDEREGKMTNRRKRKHGSETPEKEDSATDELKAFIEEKNGESITEIKKALDQRLASIEESLNFAYESLTVTSQKVTALENEVKCLRENWQTMEYRLPQLEQEREEVERVKRRGQLIFSGSDLTIPENDERLMMAVTALIDRYLELEVGPGQIIHVQRLPRDRLLVKFAEDRRGSLRDEIYRTKNKLRGHKIFINENLTPARQQLFGWLLHEQREGRVMTVLTRGGEVLKCFATRKDERLIRVRTREEALHALQLAGVRAASEPSPSEDAGAAPAPTARRPRAWTQIEGSVAGAGGESMDVGESDRSRPQPNRYNTRSLPRGDGSYPLADRRRTSEGARPSFTGASPDLPEPDRGTPRRPALGPPLDGRAGAERQEDAAKAAANTGEQPRGEPAVTGDLSGSGSAESRPERMRSPVGEVQCGRGNGGPSEPGGEWLGEDKAGRVTRTSSSLPPGLRGASVRETEADRASHLGATKPMDREGAQRAQNHADSAVISGEVGKASARGGTAGDIRTHLK